MPLVFFITCHHSKLFIEEQIEFLYDPNNLYIYHLDPKSPADLRSYVRFLSENYSNVFEMPQRNYSWAGISQVYTIVDAIIIALTYGRDWSHFIPLSEQHLSTLSTEIIKDHLDADVSYISSTPFNFMPSNAQIDIRHRFEKKYLELAGVGSFAVEKQPKDQRFYDSLHHGSNWYILSRKLCSSIRDFFSNENQLDQFKHCIHGDEVVITTIAHLIEDKAGIIKNFDSTFVAWPDVTDNNDMIFIEENFFQAKNEGKIFIRKRPAILPKKVRDVLLSNHMRYGARIIKNDLIKVLPSQENLRSAIEVDRLDSQATVQHIMDWFDGEFPEGDRTHFPASVAANIPNILIRYKTHKMDSNVSIFLISQDLQNFKVAIVTDERSNQLYVDDFLYGKDAFLIRARVAHLFFHYEISISDANHGFIHITSVRELSKIAEAFKVYVGAAENLAGH